MLTIDQYYDQLVRPILTTTLAALAESADRVRAHLQCASLRPNHSTLNHTHAPSLPPPPPPLPPPPLPPPSGHQRYVWSEVAFFARWWSEQSNQTHAKVRQLWRTGQLEFVEGGWCQADELVADLDGRAENLAVGHEWLRAHIDPALVPAVSWKIDPFGSSDLSPALLGGAQGFKYQVRCRIPAETKENWRLTGQSQRRWRSADPLAGPAEIFLHVVESYSGLSGQGFDFDQYRVPTPPINASNVAARAEVLIRYGSQWANWTSGSAGLVLLPWGGDFRWQNGTYQYDNMTLVMAEINGHPERYGSATIRFSSVSEFFLALAAWVPGGLASFPEYKGSFEPYDGKTTPTITKGGFWTGMYDSWPLLKLNTRRAQGRLRAAHQIAARVAMQTGSATHRLPWDTLAEARRPVAILQHHDALPGTSLAGVYTGSDPIHGGHVIQDYLAMLANSSAASTAVIIAGLGALAGGVYVAPIEPAYPVELSADCRSVTVLLYNAGSRPQQTMWSIDVVIRDSTAWGVGVFDTDGKPVTAQWHPMPRQFSANRPATGTRTVLFVPTVPAAGYARYELRVVATENTAAAARCEPTALPATAGAVTYGSTGSIESVGSSKVKIELLNYMNDTSGAYCFGPPPRSATAVPATVGPAESVIFCRGPIGTVSAQRWSSSNGGLELTTVLRTAANDDNVGVVRVVVTNTEPTLNNSDVVLRFSTGIASGQVLAVDQGLWWTRSNWTAYTADSVGGNMHAALHLAEIADDDTRLQLVTERVMGATSPGAGQLEVVLLRDQLSDACDLGPPDHDTSILTQTLEVRFSQTNEGDAVSSMSSIEDVQRNPLLAFTIVGTLPTRDIHSVVPEPDGWINASSLPAGVVIQDIRPMQLAPIGYGSSSKTACGSGPAVLLRLLYVATGSRAEPVVTVDPANLLTVGNLCGPQQTTLTGNAVLDDPWQRASTAGAGALVTLEKGSVVSLFGILKP